MGAETQTKSDMVSPNTDKVGHGDPLVGLEGPEIWTHGHGEPQMTIKGTETRTRSNIARRHKQSSHQWSLERDVASTHVALRASNETWRVTSVALRALNETSHQFNESKTSHQCSLESGQRVDRIGWRQPVDLLFGCVRPGLGIGSRCLQPPMLFRQRRIRLLHLWAKNTGAMNYICESTAV
jgi:hypothetical protein